MTRCPSIGIPRSRKMSNELKFFGEVCGAVEKPLIMAWKMLDGRREYVGRRANVSEWLQNARC